MEKLIALVVIADQYGHYPDGTNKRLFSCQDLQPKEYTWITDGDVEDPDCDNKFLARKGEKGTNSTAIPSTKVLEVKYKDETIFVLASKTQLNDLCQNCCTDATNAAPVITSFTVDDNTPAAAANATFTLAATDDGSVAKVEFYDGDNKIGEDAAAPFTLVRAFQAGTYFIGAKVTDNKGKVTWANWLRITVG